MTDTILFDLDGTLLPLDIEMFTKIYFNEMGQLFKDMIDPKMLVKHIWTATSEMIGNTEYKTNEEVFMDRFSKLIDGDINSYKERFDFFYDTLFHKAKEAAESQSLIIDSIAILKKKNYKLVVATNPLFPRKAIHHRIEWAGLDLKDFEYITSYEDNHFCKPQPEFYKEVLEAIGKKPEQCLMVGNDVQEDLIALKLGIKTFLIKNHMIHRTEEAINSTYEGDYEDFYSFVKKLPAVSLSS
ncbi:MAG: HAD family hydrolase [Gracilibacteraceae bacterium]|jgi:HAD superfamily hydrolase (TIGR01549 family)|nr:HAD family hydrolase [Gracilibacteraceae bacterium]